MSHAPDREQPPLPAPPSKRRAAAAKPTQPGPGCGRPVAVVGAGLAGLACAGALRDAGREVLVFDRQTEPGGRCALIATPAGPFDATGAGLRPAGKAFAAQLQAWAEAGWLQPDPQQPGHWFARGSLQALAEQLAQGLTLVSRVEVRALQRRDETWHLETEGPLPVDLAARVQQGFDAVLLALPASAALPLLGDDSELAERLGGTGAESVWALMAAWPQTLPLRADRLDADRLAAAGAVLSAAWREDSLPGRPQVSGIGSRWVLHATPAWSAERLAARPFDVAKGMLEALQAAVGLQLARPAFALTQCRPDTHVAAPLKERCGWNARLRLGACGDAWHALKGSEGPERAWLSGRALAQKVLAG
ncbi:NAD(P)-binding protein [Aquabacterium sp. A7-Y]|uniref:NAD(P)-binding protein n=1 Tax=Aquabacterium sp. A7-Y TaxID=1349605 RepID=UPI00223DECBA|nr:NAD(P)-binding protein [Aquabacterium sp. A7-Y]MCW7536645.1 NAD(P)-binding protein [Aquabacterium sp. A7-Y]